MPKTGNRDYKEWKPGLRRGAPGRIQSHVTEDAWDPEPNICIDPRRASGTPSACGKNSYKSSMAPVGWHLDGLGASLGSPRSFLTSL